MLNRAGYVALLTLLLAPSQMAIPVTYAGDKFSSIALNGAAWSHLQITVRIIAGEGVPPAAVADVIQTVDDWNMAVDRLGDPLEEFELRLTEDGDADIMIHLRKGDKAGGAVVVGATRILIRGGGSSPKVVISLLVEAFDEEFSSDLVKTIARHELGHALGLHHVSNDPSDLMAPLVPNSIPPGGVTISDCDIKGFKVAHALYFDLLQPELISEIKCYIER